jgi:hypothetical protein
MSERDVATAWGEVKAGWEDEAAHRAFLEAFSDLEGLAEVGRCYREVLDAEPSNAVALRWRDEVVKRATVLALAQMPRTPPPRPRGPAWARNLAAGAFAAVCVAIAAWMTMRLLGVAHGGK